MSALKRIAMIVRDRQAEALRVSGGLTLMDDSVEVFVLDRKLDAADPEVARPLELVNELELKVWSNVGQDGAETISLEDMAKKLLEFDVVVPY
ncbi:MAG: hypothetical protein ACYC7L_17260 [Nitrospirota bacterium]